MQWNNNEGVGGSEEKGEKVNVDWVEKSVRCDYRLKSVSMSKMDMKDMKVAGVEGLGVTCRQFFGLTYCLERVNSDRRAITFFVRVAEVEVDLF